MNQQSEHLSDAQIEQYGKSDSGAGPEAEAWVETHLDDCPLCRNRVLDFQRTRFALLPDPKVNTVPTSACPSEDDLRDLAAGLCSEPIAQKLKAHTAICDHCGPLLREYTEDFSDNFTSEEQAVLDQLTSASPKWQQQTARKMLKTAGAKAGAAASRTRESSAKSGKKPRRFFFWKWALVPGAIVGLIFLWLQYLNPMSLQSAQRAVSATYVERRTIAMRLTNVGHANFDPLPAPRGPGDPDQQYNRPNLLDAKAKIAKKQQAGDLNPQWHELRGRLDLLEGTVSGPAKAISEFQKAQSSGRDSAPLQIDLAAAYYEQDIRADYPNLERSLNLLLQVLKEPKLSSQERAVALFDLAIVYEKTHAWDLAVSTWQEFLQADPSSDWTKEGNQHLEQAQRLLHDQQQRTPHKTLSPASLLQSHNGEVTFENMEAYQEIAMRSWLVAGMGESQSEYAKAIPVLAVLMMQKHADPWWTDFLKTTKPKALDAVAHLQSSAEDNFRGLYQKAIEQALQAEAQFLKMHNVPGLLLANYERYYAEVRSFAPDTCQRVDDSTLLLLEARHYAWLQTQYQLERAVCENYAGNVSASDIDLQASRALTQAAHYPVLELRAIGLAASLKRQQHDMNQAWHQSVEGLDYYWQGPPDPERLYQFYAGMELIAQKSDLICAAERLGRHAIAILEAQDSRSKDNVRLGAAHLLLADILTGEKEDTAAKQEVDIANALLADAGEEPSANRYRLIGRVRLAEFQLKRGDPYGALMSLESSRELLKSKMPYFVSLSFYTTEGECHRELNQSEEALHAYRSAIGVAEDALHTIHLEGDRLDWIKESDRAYRGLVWLLLLHNKPEEALHWWEWYKDRSTAPFSDDVPRNPGNAIPVFKMPSYVVDEARVVYAVFPSGIQIWVSNHSGISDAWVSWREADLRSAVQEFAEKCSNPDSPLPEIQDAARQLFGRLIQPIAHELAGTKVVVIETDEVLHGLPFETLLDTENRYFAEKHALLYSPGVLQENRLRPRGNLAPGIRLMLIDSGNVLGHANERDTIKYLFPATRVVPPSQALQKIEQELSESDAVHFIGHGIRTAKGAGLLLQADAPPLTAADFSPDRLSRMRLAVLSACSSGNTDDDGLLDTTSLVHAFLAARVPAIVSTRWNVESEATSELMTSLYTHLHSGEPPALAMHAAIQQALQVNRHPYFWAGFTVTGRSL